ncbi:enoyl-CoA hydratase/isomerase family protein [Streptomyces sp. NA04227]|uniref:enoyl-CoA hydratase/isomerase family protein n=1 Tax=Streptomyces sp. NA04227 TaxID=2742136 RepID=UPI0015920EFD|nr:enoyl-CoA hydratase/isomerase family protein [Streptomyces sp. NA04227]QKW10007.1 enoyl-CoA hydratase/isomerase family protein [Streptomyces sp. NA04227]
MTTTPERTGAAEEPVLPRTEGHLGHLVLNRPRAINALTHAMVLRLDETLAAWADDPALATVLISGAGERGLCAGGDIRAIRESALQGGDRAREFWRDEYRLNARIARYPKPYVALMDGIVMGGGVGVSAHGSLRIVTERSRVAMPETGIGFVPDVGGTYLLSRAPGELGTHLALTGLPVGAADVLLCGLADHFVPSGQLDALTEDLAREGAQEVVERYRADAPEGVLARQREWIDHCYAAPTVEEIVARLLATRLPEAKETAETLLAKSPTSLKVTLEAVRRAHRTDSLEQVLVQEFRVSCATLDSADLVEGVRAQVVDKDRRPRWSPAALEEVDAETVERHFGPLAEGRDELTF